MTDSETPADDASDRTDADEPALDDLLATLESALRATEELPVDPQASVWLGEAHAVAADLTRSTPPSAVIHERVTHVEELLTNAGDTGNVRATRHVVAAQHVAASLRELTDTSNGDAG